MNTTHRKRHEQNNHPRKGITEFDSNRATLRGKNIFPPFYVKTTVPFQEALKNGKVRNNTHLLVIERNAQILALLTQQMNYHHVAQGEIAGEPWMVSL